MEIELNDIDANYVERIKSHFFCSILLKESKKYVVNLYSQGLIPEKDADGMIFELDDRLEDVKMWTRMNPKGHLGFDKQVEHLRELPQNLIDEFNLGPAIKEMLRPDMSISTYKSSLGRVDVDNLDGLPVEDMTQPLLDQGNYT